VNVVDLIEPYIDAVLVRNEPATYEQTHPVLFEHYHTFWTPRRSYARDRDATALHGQRELVRSHLNHVSACFAAHGLDLSDLEVVLFVGYGTTNGHAFCENGKFVVWIPIETYVEPLYTDVFLTHEIVHALHYSRTPAFYFETAEEKDRMSRVLITEGLATYLTSIVLDCAEAEALWGGYLPPDPLTAWMRQAEKRFGEICGFLAQNFDCSFTNHGLFCLLDTGDVFRSRAGYFVGSRVIQGIARDRSLTPNDLLLLGRPAFEDLIRERLAAASV
jgi:hypothetical protein